jgi:hypothetical protein
MRKENIEIVRLTAKEILHSLLDATVLPFSAFDKNYKTRKTVEQYALDRNFDRENLKQKIQYLKQKKLINVYTEGKDKFIEITKRGVRDIGWNQIGKSENATKWDGNWRIILFDIPEKKKGDRDIIRKKLLEIGCIQIQKSVYVYPFDCKQDFDLINYYIGSKYYMKYMVAEIIEGEQEIILKFIKKGVLEKNDLKK